jgi:hypothetical protein
VDVSGLGPLVIQIWGCDAPGLGQRVSQVWGRSVLKYGTLWAVVRTSSALPTSGFNSGQKNSAGSWMLVSGSPLLPSTPVASVASGVGPVCLLGP